MSNNNLFVGYNNTPNNYTADNLSESLTDKNIVPKPLEEYNAFGELIGYTWNYGDEVVLEFNTTGVVTEDENEVFNFPAGYFDNKQMLLEIFNSQYDVVYSETKDASQKIKFIIDDTLSSEILIRGIYRLKLTLLDNEADVSTTLFSLTDGVIYIK